MTAAVILLWVGCLWSITRSILSLLLTARPWRRAMMLAVLLLASSCAHKPQEQCGGTYSTSTQIRRRARTSDNNAEAEEA